MRIQLKEFDFACLLYGGLCSFVLTTLLSGKMMFAILMLPAGIAGIALSLPCIRYLRTSISRHRRDSKNYAIGFIVMPIVFLVLAIYHISLSEFLFAMGYFMLIGLMILVALYPVREKKNEARTGPANEPERYKRTREK